MLILAGVALRDAGVLVRLLLLGVTPLTEGDNVSSKPTTSFNRRNRHN